MLEENFIPTKIPDAERKRYQIIYNKIMDLSPKIRFVSIIASDGRPMAVGQRDGISNYLSPHTERESLGHALDAWKMRQKFSIEIGEGKYALAEYTKIKRITIPLDKDHLVYMTTEVSENHNELIEKILKIKDQQ